MLVKLLTEHHLEFLSLTGGCRGSFESTLVKISNCWKSHAAAQLCSKGLIYCFSTGAALEMSIIIGVLKTSGIFFVNFQKKFNSTSSMTSLLSTVQNGVFSVTCTYNEIF